MSQTATPTQAEVKPWDVEWRICRADRDDVARAKKQHKKHPANPGDELWRVATQIGPFAPDHDHWTGYNLGQATHEEIATAAYAPVMRRLLERIDKPDFNCAPHQFFMAVQEEARRILEEMRAAADIKKEVMAP